MYLLRSVDHFVYYRTVPAARFQAVAYQNGAELLICKVNTDFHADELKCGRMPFPGM
jgi:hypothetical protein